MWDFTEYEFKCPYCGQEWKRVVGSGNTCEYKGERYDFYTCPKCNEVFLGKHYDGIYIKKPEDESELKNHGAWMS